MQIADPVAVRVLEHAWELAWVSPYNGEKKSLQVWKGVKISPLALKARQYQKNTWEFPQARQRPILGCHTGLANPQIDLRAAPRIDREEP